MNPNDTWNTWNTWRARLVRVGAGTKLHLMYDRSKDGGKTWFSGSTVYCGSSPYAPHTVLASSADDCVAALRSLADLITEKGLKADAMCSKCSGGVRA